MLNDTLLLDLKYILVIRPDGETISVGRNKYCMRELVTENGLVCVKVPDAIRKADKSILI